MLLEAVLTVVAVVFLAVDAVSIDHDKVQPFAQPEALTVCEKAAVEYKPLFEIVGGCYPYPAVNVAGETSGGLKPTDGNSECTTPPLGSQVYGQATWYSDKWAIMYALYFPKRFTGGSPTDRHDWTNVVTWIDNPALANASVLSLSMADGVSKYRTETPPDKRVIANGTTPKFYRLTARLMGYPDIDISAIPGDSLDLIMWDQLTDAARTALNEGNFGDASVPISDPNFEDKLEKAWPF